MNADIVVVGAGLSGAIAAAAAGEKGKKVLLIAQGQGSTALTGGCIDLLGYLPWQQGYLLDIEQGLKELTARLPEHPYAKVGCETVSEAVNYFKGITAKMGCAYRGDGVTNYLLPTAAGSARPTALIPRTMEAGNILGEEDVVIVGAIQLTDFYPKLITDRVNLFRKRMQLPESWCSARVDLGVRRVMTPLRLAGWLEAEENLAKFIAALKAVVPGGAVVGLPAVLGSKYSTGIFDRVQQELKCRLFEIPSGSPAITGMRLDSLVLDYAKQQGVELRFGHPVSRVEQRFGSRCVVTVNNCGRDTKVNCRHLIIATGGLYGKGIISSRESTFESVTDAPLVFPEGCRALSKIPLTAQAHRGVPVNSGLHPADREGNGIQQMIRVVGRSLAHYDPVLEKSGLGVALATGYAAGKSAGEAV